MYRMPSAQAKSAQGGSAEQPQPNRATRRHNLTPRSSATVCRWSTEARERERERKREREREQLLGDLLPPLAPPLRTDEDAQLRVPAVGDLLVGVEVVEAVVALLVAVGHALQDRVFCEVAQLDGELLVDLFGLGDGEVVVGHGVPELSRTQ